MQGVEASSEGLDVLGVRMPGFVSFKRALTRVVAISNQSTNSRLKREPDLSTYLLPRRVQALLSPEVYVTPSSAVENTRCEKAFRL